MASVLRRPRAADDVAGIWEHIADDSVRQADAWVDRLDEKLSLLATQPKMGRARDELAPGLRCHPFERYLLFYVALDTGIDLVRVLHSARDVDALFVDD